ncbi:hypothetical protein C8R43DRAFT_1192070 [Mycena crocata]|nr:hypothetical protein C8R43DRAFT_1192070 [Mycena crocata]
MEHTSTAAWRRTFVDFELAGRAGNRFWPGDERSRNGDRTSLGGRRYVVLARCSGISGTAREHACRGRERVFGGSPKMNQKNSNAAHGVADGWKMKWEREMMGALQERSAEGEISNKKFGGGTTSAPDAAECRKGARRNAKNRIKFARRRYAPRPLARAREIMGTKVKPAIKFAGSSNIKLKNCKAAHSAADVRKRRAGAEGRLGNRKVLSAETSLGGTRNIQNGKRHSSTRRKPRNGTKTVFGGRPKITLGRRVAPKIGNGARRRRREDERDEVRMNNVPNPKAHQLRLLPALERRVGLPAAKTLKRKANGLKLFDARDRERRRGVVGK